MRWLDRLACLLIGTFSFAQQFPSTHYTDRDFLPHNTVRSMFIANDGALWIGTDNGLVRKFNNVSNSFFREDGLSQNNIWAIAEGLSGQIWIGSYGKGLTTYQNGKLYPYKANAALPNPEITQLFVHANMLYVGTR